jgi:hypothetical protein
LRKSNGIGDQVTEVRLIIPAVRADSIHRVDAFHAIQRSQFDRYIVSRERPPRKVSGFEAAIGYEIRRIRIAEAGDGIRPALSDAY